MNNTDDQPEMKEKPSDVSLPEFHLHLRYPNATRIFEISVPSLEVLRSEAVFAIDTNVLLLPYKLKAERLDQIAVPFRALLGENRLFVPGHVAREFARQRENRLSDLYHDISSKMNVNISLAEYSFLEGITEFTALQASETDAIDKIKTYKDCLKKLRAVIEAWRWNDPVSNLYRELFNLEVIVDCSLEQALLKKDQERRWSNNISPGFKDRGKEDTGIGDVIIWNTLLELGRTKNRPLVFVTGDAKADWMVQSDKRGLFARFELVAEYHHISGGNTFEIITLSDLLKLFNINDDVIKEVKDEEVKESESQVTYSEDTKVGGVTLFFSKENEANATLAEEYLKKYFPSFIFSTEARVINGRPTLDVEFDKIVTLRVLEFLIGKLDLKGMLVEDCMFREP